MSKALTPAQKKKTIGTALEAYKPELAKAMEGTVLTPEKMLRTAMTSIALQPKLANCTVESLCGALMQCTAFQLYPDGVVGDAHLVPFKDKCQLIVGYKGLMKLAYRSGEVTGINAYCVYENDELDVKLGTNPSMKHVPWYMRDKAEPGKRIGAYATAQWVKTGEHQFRFCPEAEIQKHRKMSKDTRPDATWNTNPDEMAEKTAIRIASKRWPMATEAVALEEIANAGKDQHMERFVDLPASAVEDVTDTYTVPAEDTTGETVEVPPKSKPDPVEEHEVLVKEVNNMYGLRKGDIDAEWADALAAQCGLEYLPSEWEELSNAQLKLAKKALAKIKPKK